MLEDLELYNAIGKKIKKRRQELGLTQEELADLTHYSDSFIANIESKTYQSFSISALNNIAKVLNTNITNLLPTKLEIKSNANEIKCNYCDYKVLIPQELSELLKYINNLANKKIKLTCPVCHKKIG